MTRLPRPNSKTERIARRRVLSYMWAATKQDLYREPYRQRLMELDHGAPLTTSDMRPVWKARRERRRLGRSHHLGKNLDRRFVQLGQALGEWLWTSSPFRSVRFS